MDAFMMKMAAQVAQTEYVESDADVWGGNANSFCIGRSSFSWSALIASGHNSYFMLMLAAALVRLSDKEGVKLAMVTENTDRKYLPAGRVAADGLPEAIDSVDAAKLLLSVCRKSRGGGGTEVGAAGGPPPSGAVEAGADDAIHVAAGEEATEARPPVEGVHLSCTSACLCGK